MNSAATYLVTYVTKYVAADSVQKCVNVPESVFMISCITDMYVLEYISMVEYEAEFVMLSVAVS